MNEFEPSPLRTTPFCKLSNKTFLRSILSDPDLKRRTMHACNEHRVCRQRHTYTHVHIYANIQIHTYIYIATEGRNTLPRRTHFCLPGKLREHERKRKERCKATVSPSRSIFLPIDRSSPSYRAKYRAPTFVLTNRLLSFFSILREDGKSKAFNPAFRELFRSPFPFFFFSSSFLSRFRSLFAVSRCRSLAFENAFEKGGT